MIEHRGAERHEDNATRLATVIWQRDLYIQRMQAVASLLGVDKSEVVDAVHMLGASVLRLAVEADMLATLLLCPPVDDFETDRDGNAEVSYMHLQDELDADSMADLFMVPWGRPQHDWIYAAYETPPWWRRMWWPFEDAWWSIRNTLWR